MVVLLPILILVVGVLVYALASNPKVQEMGRIAYFCGLLAFLLQGAEKVVTLLK